MIYWETEPANYRHPKKIANLYPAIAYACDQVGVEICLSRVFEASMRLSSGRINVSFEAIEGTYICVDREYPGIERKNVHGLEPKACIELVTIYPPELGTPSPGGGRQNDIYTLTLGFYKPHENPYYSEDREVVAERLLHTAHNAWVDSWRLMEQVQGHRRGKWPVKLWIHGHNETVYQITDDERLVTLPDHPPISDSILDHWQR